MSRTVSPGPDLPGGRSSPARATSRPALRRAAGASGGFSAIELIITASMIMVLASLSITAAVNQWRSEQAYAVAEELAGWIATVQRAAMRGLRCDVTIAPNSGSLATGAVLAQASQSSSGSLQNSCTAYSPMRIESVPSPSQFTVSPSALTFSFTPAAPSPTTAPIRWRSRCPTRPGAMCAASGSTVCWASPGWG